MATKAKPAAAAARGRGRKKAPAKAPAKKPAPVSSGSKKAQVSTSASAKKAAIPAPKALTEIKVVGGLKSDNPAKASLKKLDVHKLVERAPALDMSYVSQRKNREIWALNINPLGGQLVADLGDSVVLRIPDTWIPINLTNLVPKEALERSTSFRDAIRDVPGKGRRIKIIHPDIAAEILSRPESKIQLQLLDDKARERVDAAQNAGSREKAMIKEEEQAQNAQARVVELLARRHRGQLTSKAFWQQFDAMRPTAADVSYVALNANSADDKTKARKRQKRLG